MHTVRKIDDDVLFAVPVPEKDARKALIELREKYSRKMKQREDVEKTIQTKTNQCAAVAEEIRNSNEKLVFEVLNDISST